MTRARLQKDLKQCFATPNSRPNQIFAHIVPPLLLTFALAASDFVLFELGPFLAGEKHPFLCRLYQICFVIPVTIALGIYLSILCFPLRPRHNACPLVKSTYECPTSLQLIQQKSIVYQTIDHLGTPRTCQLCDGRLLPIRARHCLDCRTCVTGFDHHCLWFANCISIDRSLKPFLQVMFFTVLSIVIGAYPLINIVRAHLRLVLEIVWNDELLYQVWWNRWRSWMGGPVYRYIGGLCVGYIYFDQVASTRSNLVSLTKTRPQSGFPPNLSLDRPSLFIFILLLISALIASIAVAMMAITLRNLIFRGLSTIEIERSRKFKRLPTGSEGQGGWNPRMKLWVPDGQQMGNGKVVLVEPGVPIFDLGPWQNWKYLMGECGWEWLVPWSVTHKKDGIHWPISEKWMKYLQGLPALSESAEKESCN